MVKKSESYDRNAFDANLLRRGQFINTCTMISPQLYLSDYKLTYDGTVPEDELPIIATISQREFKESLL